MKQFPKFKGKYDVFADRELALAKNMSSDLLSPVVERIEDENDIWLISNTKST